MQLYVFWVGFSYDNKLVVSKYSQIRPRDTLNKYQMHWRVGDTYSL